MNEDVIYDPTCTLVYKQKFNVYVKVMNPRGRDFWGCVGSSPTEEGLYFIVRKLRDQFTDTFESLDSNAYIGDENENRFQKDIHPSFILKKYGGKNETTINRRIKKCENCFYYINTNLEYCPSIGKKCDKFISIDDYWTKKHTKVKIQ